ncbi:DUF2283 domain-containing protein [Amycolatopsis sp. NPDC051372]|uniref:DUF2283 domain-containing protein n=1 Tax=Amycolatopsis sp. NPDC051372 TaxID=3155669 RepID=UPI00343C1296
MINLDFSADGRVLGVEMLDARGKLPRFLLDGAERIDRPARGKDFRRVTAAKETFNGSEIKLFDVVTEGERLIEFRDRAWREDAAVLVLPVPRGSSWTDATVTINPSRGAVPVAFLAWAREIAKLRMTRK